MGLNHSEKLESWPLFLLWAEKKVFYYCFLCFETMLNLISFGLGTHSSYVGILSAKLPCLLLVK